MGTGIQLSPAQAAEAMNTALEAQEKYNATHEDTRMIIRELPGGNVQIIIEKV